jgi:uncharacterized protein (TIGR02594 family)
MNKLLQIAIKEYGVKEIVGGNHNPIILNYFKEIGHNWVTTDETAWCSAFINYCALKAQLPMSNKLNARSWLSIGKPVDKPLQGDLVIYWRESPDSWKGHVGIYISDDGKMIETLGGNQRNRVCIMPYMKSQLLGYRRLS